MQVPPSPPVVEAICHEYGEGLHRRIIPPPEDQTLVGLVGTEGSMVNPRFVCARRSGWSTVKCGPEGKLLYALYGACPDRCPTARRAELWAFKVMTDCKALIDCLDRQGVLL